MKKKYKVLLWICGVIIAFFVLANILLGAYAPKIIQQQIEQNLKLKANLGKVSFSLLA